MNQDMPTGSRGRGAVLVDKHIEELVSELTRVFGRPAAVIYPAHADNAIGRDSLDAMVSHLLRRIEGGGPPPLPRNQIEEIPLVEVSSSLQCTICCEVFQFGEQARKLKCTHMYHDECITRWLEQHGTCPLCRKNLANGGGGGDDDDDHEEQPQQTSGRTMTLQNSRSALRHAAENEPGHSSAFSAAPSSSTSPDGTVEQSPSTSPNFD